MRGRPRYLVINRNVVGLYHVWCRTVRQMWLYEFDPVTGRDLRYRKQWIYDRIKELVGIYAVDACVYAILSNHFHLIVRNRVDLARQWTDEEVARRWWELCPQRREPDGSPSIPTDLELRTMLSVPADVVEWRERLSDISWFMKSLNEWIARLANAEDNVKGHFVDDRFGARSLLDETAVLACSLYVDLNEIRAQLASIPEESTHTSAYVRILARLRCRERDEAAGRLRPQRRYDPGDPDFFLSPLPEQDYAPLLGPADVPSVQASLAYEPKPEELAHVNKRWRHGFLPMSLDDYLELLDWHARKIVPAKMGLAELRVPPILERMGLNPESWIRMVENFDRWFPTAAGMADSLRAEADRRGNQWLHGVNASSKRN